MFAYVLGSRFASCTEEICSLNYLISFFMLLISKLVLYASLLIFLMLSRKLSSLIRSWYCLRPCTNSFSSFFRKREQPNCLGMLLMRFILMMLNSLTFNLLFWLGTLVFKFIILPSSSCIMLLS